MRCVTNLGRKTKYQRSIWLDTLGQKISQIKSGEGQVVPLLRMKSFAEGWKEFNVCLAPYAKKDPKCRWWQPGTVGWVKKWPNKLFTKNLAKKRQRGDAPYAICVINKETSPAIYWVSSSSEELKNGDPKLLTLKAPPSSSMEDRRDKYLLKADGTCFFCHVLAVHSHKATSEHSCSLLVTWFGSFCPGSIDSIWL